MSSTTRILTATIALIAMAASTSSVQAKHSEEPTKQWVWLEKQGLWGYGYQIQDGPFAGLWRVDPDSKRAPEPPSDPYGFAAILNTYRASAGLPPLSYEPDLSNWAANNNVEQANRGLGHHVNPNCFQNCAWNTPDAASVASAWMESPGHRANMLSPSVSRFGIAYGPGPYWTMNAQ